MHLPRTVPFIVINPYIKVVLVLSVLVGSVYAIASAKQKECIEQRTDRIETENPCRVLQDSKKLQAVLVEGSLAFEALNSLIEKELANISSTASSGSTNDRYVRHD